MADTEILKITLDGKAQEYTILKSMSEAADNASRWMKTNPQMMKFNESLKQIDNKLNDYTANLEDFRRIVLPKMSSGSSERIVDAQAGAKLIEEYKKQRLQLA